MTTRRHIAIAGAGIGGLTAALALAARGMSVTVCERAPQLSEVGAGLQLAANATGILRRLGLLDTIAARACVPESLEVHSVASSGAPLVTMPIGDGFARRYGAPYLVVHRADLQRALLDAVNANPAIKLHLDTPVTDVETLAEGVRLVLSLTETLTADGLVGADGVRSAVRSKVLAGAPALYSGNTAYRATIPAAETPPEIRNKIGLWMSEKAHLVHYPLRGGEEINLVAVVRDPWVGEGWSHPAERAEVIARLAEWPEPAASLISAPSQWVKWALCGTSPDFTWTRDRVTLLGDACHPTLPFLAQGAAMSIEDAWVLAGELAKPVSVPAAFKAYEQARKARVVRILGEGARNGKVYHLGGIAAHARDLGLKLLGPDRLASRYDWLWSWQPEAA